MIGIIKCACCVTLIFSMSIVRIYCQSNDISAIYDKIVLIDTNSKLSKPNKLVALRQIKNHLERQKKTNDSAYILALIKIAKYKFNEDIDTSIGYSINALEINKRSSHPVSMNVVINALSNLAIYYQTSLQQIKALSLYDTVIFLSKKEGMQNYLIQSRYRKADIYSSLGDHQKVIDESTLGIHEALENKDSLYYAIFLNFRADGQMSENDFSEALSDIETAISIEKTIKDTYWLATSYEKKALVYQKQMKLPEALTLFLQAIKTCPRMPLNLKTLATYHNNLANFYLYSLYDITRAKENYLKAIDYGIKCDLITKGLISLMAYENLAEASLQEHKLKESVNFYTLALNQTNLKTKNFLLDNPSANQLSVLEYRDLLFTLLFGKVSLLLQLYKETAQHVYLKSCLQTASIADTLITKTRHESLSESSKLYWRDETREFFDNAIEACYNAKDVNNAFYFMERSRAVLLNDKWNELNANNLIPEKEIMTLKNLETKIIEQKQLLSTFQQGSTKYNNKENELLLTIDSLEHFIKSLEKKYPLYYETKYADDVPSHQSLQKFLVKNNESFVYYYLNDSAMYVLAITKNKTSFIKIIASDFNSHQLSQFIRLCSDKQQLNSNHPLYCSLSQTIYKKLFEPLHIPKGNVAICTDNFFIPFEALCSDDKGKDFLLNDYNFSYVYSARSLMKPFTTRAASGNFIGFAPVSFSSSLAVPDLLQSGTALQNAAQFYSNNTLFTGEQASRQSFFSNASRYSVVTIFSHAKADTTDAEPELFMQDSVIHLSELQRLNNPSIQFVLLSACQTNIGKNATGEGIYSLARGFASAGIPAVSATLWKADEETIYQISTKFNEYLSQGMNKSEALQKAKLWYLQNADHEHTMPYYWANMVLIGSSQPIVLTSSSHLWLWVSAIVVGFVFAAFLVYRFSFKNKRITTPNNK